MRRERETTSPAGTTKKQEREGKRRKQVSSLACPEPLACHETLAEPTADQDSDLAAVIERLRPFLWTRKGDTANLVQFKKHSLADLHDIASDEERLFDAAIAAPVTGTAKRAAAAMTNRMTAAHSPMFRRKLDVQELLFRRKCIKSFEAAQVVLVLPTLVVHRATHLLDALFSVCPSRAIHTTDNVLACVVVVMLAAVLEMPRNNDPAFFERMTIIEVGGLHCACLLPCQLSCSCCAACTDVAVGVVRRRWLSLHARRAHGGDKLHISVARMERRHYLPVASGLGTRARRRGRDGRNRGRNRGRVRTGGVPLAFHDGGKLSDIRRSQKAGS
jgi:hypothetical protein